MVAVIVVKKCMKTTIIAMVTVIYYDKYAVITIKGSRSRTRWVLNPWRLLECDGTLVEIYRQGFFL